MTTSFSFGYRGSDEEVDGRCSCEGMRAPCDWVASGGSRRIGSGCNLLGSVAGQAEWFFGGSVVEGEMIEFLDE